MTEYHDHFNNAELLSRIDLGEELLGRLPEDQIAALEEQKPDQIPRLQALLPALRERVDGSDPLCITASLLESTRASLVAVTDGLQNFIDSSQPEHLDGIRDWTESLAQAIGTWPGKTELPSSDVREVAARFRRSAGQQLRGLSKDFGETQDKVAAIQAEVEQRSGEMAERQTGLDSQLSELQTTIEQQRGRLDEAIERYQQQFSEAQERRIEEFRNEISELQSSSSEAREAADHQLTRISGDIREQADEAISEMTGLRTQAEEIAGVIGATGTSSGYRKEADAQKKVANQLRISAILFGLAAAGLAVWAIIHAQESTDPSFTVVLAKAIGSLVFVGIAGYLATQSSHHRMREEQARRRQLDLIALPPFIAALPQQEREDITGEIAGKIFVTPAASPPGKQEVALTKESISLVGLLLEAIRRS